jgi:hypothetical protein
VEFLEGERFGPMLHPQILEGRSSLSPDRQEEGEKDEREKKYLACFHDSSGIDHTKVRHFCIIV